VRCEKFPQPDRATATGGAPVDTKSNNVRILINRDAVVSMEAAEVGAT
jgi:hypothetical protein